MYVYFGLGTDLDDKEHNPRLTVRRIEKRVGRVIPLSVFHTTVPWDFSSERTSLDATTCVEVLLSPLSVLHFTQKIEREIGHTHKSIGRVYSDRVIDIDLLSCGDQVLDAPELKLPHPLMHEHRFVLEPLAETTPDLAHPILKKKMLELL